MKHSNYLKYALGKVSRKPGGSALPQVASATLLLDLQADTLSLGALSTWPDASGLGHNFTQTGDARPTVQDVDGYKAVQFDGVDDWMDGSNFADNLDKLAVVTVSRRNGVSTYGGIIAKVDSNQKGWTVSRYGGGLYIQDTNGDNYVDVSVPDFPSEDTFAVTTIELLDLATSAAHVYINGDNSGEVDQSFGTVPEYSVSENVKLGVVNSFFANCDIRAVTLYQITNTGTWATDRAAIEAWLADRYGVTL